MYATVVVECESLFLNRGEGFSILARALFELPMPRKRIQKLNSLEHSPATGHSGKEFATKAQLQPSHRPSQKLSDSTIPYDSFRSGQNVLPESQPPKCCKTTWSLLLLQAEEAELKQLRPKNPKLSLRTSVAIWDQADPNVGIKPIRMLIPFTAATA